MSTAEDPNARDPRLDPGGCEPRFARDHRAGETGTGDHRSVGTLLTDAMSHIGTLIRREVDLARAEINENVSRAVTAVGLLVGAVVIALTALNVLSAALVAALTELGIDGGWAALIVGVLWAIIALVLAMKGINDLKASSLAPTRTTKNVRRDAETVKESFNG
jgi:hypothetical protein